MAIGHHGVEYQADAPVDGGLRARRAQPASRQGVRTALQKLRGRLRATQQHQHQHQHRGVKNPRLSSSINLKSDRLLALLLNALNATLPESLMSSLAVFPATYTLLGMMIIGMTLSQVTLAAWDTRFVATCVGLRYLLWPLVMLGAVLVLQQFTPLAPELAMALLLFGVVPMASNVVIVAMELGIQPQKGALAVLTTTLLAPLLIPLYLGLMLRLTGLG